MEEKLLNEWKERLGLQEWYIKLIYNCKATETDYPDSAVGQTEWQTTNKSAIIKIISEQEHGGDRILPYDFEKTLVHELLHIKFSIIDKRIDTYEGAVAEQVRHQLIDDIARALVMAKRGYTTRSQLIKCNSTIAKDANFNN